MNSVAGAATILSARETEVLQCIASGMTHRQVANRLDISQHTVDTYIKRIKLKLGAGNKAELTRAAIAMLGHGRSLAPPVAVLGETAEEHRAVPPLSAREREVLRHLSKGMTDAQVAKRLAISRHTVDTYLRRIRAKLQLGNKADLTRAALVAGVLHDSSPISRRN